LPHDPPEPSDDLEAFRAQRSRRTRRRTRWLAAVLAVALLVPAGRWAIDEITFRLSGAAVVETLEGERSGADLADTVLLVRAAGCRPQSSGSGSAFVLSTPDGPRLVTNRHVVEDTRRVGVTSLDASLTLEVTDIQVSEVADVAVLHVEDEDRLPPPLALADEAPAAGDRVRLIGFPAARPFTTAGKVAEVAPGRLLLDLRVDRGASGSPVVAADGRVVGQVHAVTRDGQGVATPADRLPGALEHLRPLVPC
jgi:S1-C subfamily serine protease